MRIVSRKAQACEQVRLRASQLRDRTAVHVRPPREWPRAGHEPSAKTARWDRRAARCPQEKRGVSAVLAGMVEGTDQIGQTMKSLSSWPNGKSPRAGGTNFSGLLADRADQIDLDAAAVDQQSRSSNRGARGKRRISRKWIIPRPRVCLRRVVLRKALARHRSKANQKTRDDNCRAGSHPLPPHTSIGVQRGAFKDAAVKSLTSLSVGCWLPLAPLGSGDHNL